MLKIIVINMVSIGCKVAIKGSNPWKLVDVIFLRKRNFAYMIRLGIFRQEDNPRLSGCILNAIIIVHIREKQEDQTSYTQRRR